MYNTTTTRNGIRVEDISFKDARKQSEILKEMDTPVQVDSDDTPIPVSMTPEQVNKYLTSKQESTNNQSEKKFLGDLISLLYSLFEDRKKLVALELQEDKRRANAEISDEI